MRIAIFGVGAVGGYFGGRLAAAGEDVLFVARGRTLEALATDGLRIASAAGDFRVHPVQVTGDPASVGPVDVVILGVKAWQVPEAARQMLPLLADESVVLPLQNGVEAPDQLAAVVGRERVLGGLCRIIAFVVRPGQIRHAGAEPYVALGELDDHASARVERLRQAFVRAGIRAEVPSSVRTAMWEKFLFIAAVSGVGAATRVPLGVIRRLPETRELLVRALREVWAVGRGQGVPLADDAIERTLAFVDSLPEQAMASMQRDVMEGHPSELWAQTGAVVRLGRQGRVPTPVNELLYAVLLPAEMAARGASGR